LENSVQEKPKRTMTTCYFCEIDVFLKEAGSTLRGSGIISLRVCASSLNPKIEIKNTENIMVNFHFEL
jgi:hypothetical protein